MKRWIAGLAAVGLGLAGAGCSVNFYAGRASDAKTIEELKSELERLRAQKKQEANQLEETKRLLEQRLRDEIGRNQVKLEMAERGLVLTFVAEVLFDSGKAVLRSEATKSLGKVAGVITEKASDRNIGIEGHTDNVPISVSGWKSNWELSTARAISVLHFLEENGVAPDRLVASGYGEYRPVAANDAAEGRQKNRRVEIVILPKEWTERERELIREGIRSNEPELVEKASALEGYK